ncbi:class I SAM-dependent methyltransferase [Rhizobiales bacterium]|uniref:class I SAM-dependent methyltransferase n=1 Tax=Hongsoonwoonella zoysiae TaxID=2821844 RepID=UPI00155FB436|nr:class I SAM-dependent methyltransferase [Hongsoonwoonella zoysiae]NRG19711.1 class I SAM-dependent methyltransferase [Hongsoonwoonella zoysiae]
MAETALGTLSRRTRFVARQGARVAWFAAHGEALRRLQKRIRQEQPSPPPNITPSKPVPSQRELIGHIIELFRRDLANVEAGIYPLPRGEFGSPAEFLALSRKFFQDAPKVARRRYAGGHQEIFEETRESPSGLPRYYRQNFHFQSGGWLTEESARLYDFQVEVLFTGATAAMRRQALVPFSEMVRAKDQRRLAYADIACGTGGLLLPALEAFPRLKGTGVDLSAAYMSEARDRATASVKRRASFAAAPAEQLPFADESLDVLSTVYLFHELPPKVRRQAAKEFARVLKPGGRLIFVDSLKTGETPAFDGLLELFPQLFHEPYFTSYLEEDLDGMFEGEGLRLQSFETAFFSRVAAYEKA